MKLDRKTVEKKLNEKRAINEEVDSSGLVYHLQAILADTMIFYFKAHSFHWNVEGPNFSEYHDFFSGVYEDAFGDVDPLAEYIRQLGVYAPNSLVELIAKGSISELTSKPGSAIEMFRVLKADNDRIMVGLASGRSVADSFGKTDISNFLDDLIGKHRKLNWKLESFLK